MMVCQYAPPLPPALGDIASVFGSALRALHPPPALALAAPAAALLLCAHGAPAHAHAARPPAPRTHAPLGAFCALSPPRTLHPAPEGQTRLSLVCVCVVSVVWGSRALAETTAARRARRPPPAPHSAARGARAQVMADAVDVENEADAAPAPLQVTVYRVEHGEGLSMPCISLANRRAAGSPLTRWICQRHLYAPLQHRQPPKTRAKLTRRHWSLPCGPAANRLEKRRGPRMCVLAQ